MSPQSSGSSTLRLTTTQAPQRSSLAGIGLRPEIIILSHNKRMDKAIQCVDE